MVLKVRKLNAMRFPKTTDTGNSALNELDNCLNLFGRNRKQLQKVMHNFPLKSINKSLDILEKPKKVIFLKNINFGFAFCKSFMSLIIRPWIAI